MHRNFLEQYFRRANFNYGDIVDDTYIFSNLGYHLYKSEQFHLFPKIFLDLSFVEAVLKANGPVDLLNDYKKYEDQIMGVVRKTPVMQHNALLPSLRQQDCCLCMVVIKLESKFVPARRVPRRAWRLRDFCEDCGRRGQHDTALRHHPVGA